MGPEEPYDVRSQVIEYIKSQNIVYEIRTGEVIYIQRGKKDEVYIELAGKGVMAWDKAVDDILKGSHLTTTNRVFDEQMLIAIQRKIESMLKKFKFVKNAQVHITRADQKAIYGFSGGEGARASVLLELAPGKRLEKENVYGIANILSTAVPHLKLSDVKIVDTTGRWYKTSYDEAESVLANSVRELQEAHEIRINQKVLEILQPYYDAVYVSSSVKISSKSMTEKLNEIKPGETIHSEKREHIDKSNLGANTVGVQKEATELPGQGQGMSMNVAEKENKNSFVPSTYEKNVTTPPGEIEDISVAVVISVKDEKEASNPQKVKDTKELVRNATGPDVKEEKISVVFMPIAAPKEIPSVTAGISPLEMIEKYAPSVFIGLVSLIALFMVYRIINSSISKSKVLDTQKVQEILQRELEQVSKLPTEPEVERIKEALTEAINRSPKVSASILKQWILEG